MAGGARERRPRSSASDAQKARAVTIVTRTGGDTGERWLRSRIFARDWSVTDRRAGRPNVLSQFAPIADIWRTKAEVRKGPTTDINRWGIPKAAESCTRAARAFKGGKGISAPEMRPCSSVPWRPRLFGTADGAELRKAKGVLSCS